MNTLRLALIQSAPQWEKPNANRHSINSLLAGIRGTADLVVLPEMFNSGFSMNATRVAESMDGPSVNWMLQAAAMANAVCGSLAIREGERVYNRFILARPDGGLEHYDKRHLFRMAGEDRHYHAGGQRRVMNWLGWRLCPMVCYDLRFPVWSRCRDDYDALIYVANWPARRRHHWRQLLIARAIENQCFVIGVNRVGLDRQALSYSGDSLVIDPQGQILIDPMDQPGTHHCSIELEQVIRYRQAFPAALDADGFDMAP